MYFYSSKAYDIEALFNLSKNVSEPIIVFNHKEHSI